MCFRIVWADVLPCLQSHSQPAVQVVRIFQQAYRNPGILEFPLDATLADNFGRIYRQCIHICRRFYHMTIILCKNGIYIYSGILGCLQGWISVFIRSAFTCWIIRIICSIVFFRGLITNSILRKWRIIAMISSHECTTHLMVASALEVIGLCISW